MKALLGIIGIAIIYLIVVPVETSSVHAHADPIPVLPVVHTQDVGQVPAQAEAAAEDYEHMHDHMPKQEAPPKPEPDPNPSKAKASASDNDCLCGPDCPCLKAADHEARLQALEKKAAYPLQASQAVKSGGSSGSYPSVQFGGSTGNYVIKSGGYSSRSLAPAYRTPVRDTIVRWTNNDGLSRRQHVEQVHGISTAGMTEADVIAEQNAYHDTYGPGHPTLAPKLPMAPSGPGCPGGYQTADGYWVCPQKATMATRQERSVLDNTRWSPGKVLSKVLRR